jgi:hypothetical protein
MVPDGKRLQQAAGIKRINVSLDGLLEDGIKVNIHMVPRLYSRATIV